MDATQLKRIPLFADASDEELAKVATFAQSKEIPEGEEVVSEGGFSRELLAIEDGTAEAVLGAIGPTIHHVGDGEQARIVKLAINLMIAVLAQVMSEALVLGEAAGVSRATLLEVMGSSAAGAPFVKYKTEALLREDFSATFTTALMEKDVDLALDAAREGGVQLPLAR